MKIAAGTTLASVVCLMAAACGGSAPASAPVASPAPAGPTPAAVWSGLETTEPVLGGSVFGGPGNQYAFEAAAYGAGFVVVGEDHQSDADVTGRIWLSSDGTSWALETDPNGVFARSEVDHIASNGKRLVAIGGPRPADATAPPTQLVWVSDDGMTWHRSDAAASALKGISVGAIRGNGAGFLAWGIDASGASTILTSLDGETWTTSDFASKFPDSTLGMVAVRLGTFVAVGAHRSKNPGMGGPTAPAEAFVSADGQHWSQASIDGPALGSAYAGSDGFLATGAGSDCGGCVGPSNLWHSDDGQAWRLVGHDPVVNATYAGDGSRIVRAGVTNFVTVDWSTDGLKWQSLAAPLPFHDEYGPFVFGPKGILFLENPTNGPETDAGVWYLPAR